LQQELLGLFEPNVTVPSWPPSLQCYFSLALLALPTLLALLSAAPQFHLDGAFIIREFPIVIADELDHLVLWQTAV